MKCGPPLQFQYLRCLSFPSSSYWVFNKNYNQIGNAMSHEPTNLAHSTEVANRFLDLASNEGRYLTQMQVQKLVYVSHGWHLAIFDSGLTKDEPEAWDYGPLYRSLWIAIRKYGNGPVTEKIRKEDFTISLSRSSKNTFFGNRGICQAAFSNDQERLIQRIFDVYGELSAFELSALTHQKDTPWYKIYVDKALRREKIPQDLIKEHFTTIAKEANETE